jgi:two-component system, response regulator PdtaR
MPNDEGSVPQPRSILSANLKVLIAEDENILAWEMEDLLRDFGVSQIFWSVSIKGVREILAAEPDISLVLLDLKLQDGGSDVLIGELLAKSIPLIVVTGYNNRGDSRFPVLTKPYSPQSLLAAIKEALTRP